jgi:hypothetical protein
VTGLDISNNVILEELLMTGTNLNAPPLNDLTSLDTSQHIKLRRLALGFNYNLTELDVSNNILLEEGSLHQGSFSEIDLSLPPELDSLFLGYWIPGFLEEISNPLLTNVEVSNNLELEFLTTNSTAIPPMDLSNNPKLLL